LRGNRTSLFRLMRVLNPPSAAEVAPWRMRNPIVRTGCFARQSIEATTDQSSSPNNLIRGISTLTGSAAKIRVGPVSSLTFCSTSRNS
jgi:hypothetical protein